MNPVATFLTLLPLIMGGNSSAGIIVRPGDGTYTIGTPITFVLEQVHMCAWIQVQIDGLETTDFSAAGDCDTGVGVATVRVLVPAKVERVTLTPHWFNGDPLQYFVALVDMKFEEAK